MSQPRITYQPALDGLRALAVAAVIAYHLGYPWAQGGFLGVDTFFVLSGFLITSLLLAERTDTGRISLRGFWARRARRLLPALFVLLAVVCLYAPVEIPDFQLGALRGDAIAAIFYVSNWHAIAIDHSYFDLFTNPSPLNHLWSLAIEEQFYLLWPLIVIGLLRVSRGTRRALWIVTILGILGSQLAMSLLYDEANPSRAYYGTGTRAHTILIGCLLALILRARPDLPARGGKILQGLGVLALGVVVAAFSLGRADAAYFNGRSLAFAVAVAFVIAAAIAPNGLIRWAFSIPVARYVGRISYGLYLWHWPVIVFMTGARFDVGPNVLNALRLAVTFAITAASFHFVEQPILRRRGGKRITRALLPIGLSVVVASVLVGTAGATSPTRVLGRITGSIGRCGPAPKHEVRRAERELRRLGGITVTPPPAKQRRRVAVFGDSRACSLLTGIEVGAPQFDATVGDGAMLGCGLVSGAIAQHYAMMPRQWALSCEGRVNRVVDEVLKRDRPELVIWFSGWEVSDLDVDNKEVVFGTPQHRLVILERLEALYRRTKAPGRKLVILSLPEESPSTLLPDPNRELGLNTARLNVILAEFAAQHPDEVAVVDFARYVCPTAQPCPRFRDGLEPRPYDGIHFTAEGATWAAKWLWPQLLAIWPAPAAP